MNSVDISIGIAGIYASQGLSYGMLSAAEHKLKEKKKSRGRGFEKFVGYRAKSWMFL